MLISLLIFYSSMKSYAKINCFSWHVYLKIWLGFKFWFHHLSLFKILNFGKMDHLIAMYHCLNSLRIQYFAYLVFSMINSFMPFLCCLRMYHSLVSNVLVFFWLHLHLKVIVSEFIYLCVSLYFDCLNWITSIPTLLVLLFLQEAYP